MMFEEIPPRTAMVLAASIGFTGLGFVLNVFGVTAPAIVATLIGTGAAGYAGYLAYGDYQSLDRQDPRHAEVAVGQMVDHLFAEAATLLPPDEVETTIDATGTMYRHHPAALCEGRGCPIHHPSHHHMRTWPMIIRGDRDYLIERQCAHGIGHPDPDSLGYFRMIDPLDRGRWEVHGCDACCTPPHSLPDELDDLDDTNGCGANLVALQRAVEEASSVVHPSAISQEELEAQMIEVAPRCLYCDLPTFRDEQDRAWHYVEGRRPQRSCPSARVENPRVLTVATPPSPS